MFDIYDVANEFLSTESMTPKKLQKLCYYAQGWYLALTTQKLFNDNIEAWVHGPVCPTLYENFKTYGYSRIPKVVLKSHNEELKGIVQQIYRIYGKLDADQLEEKTHKELPWINARKGLEPYESSNNIISCNDMEQFFRSKLLEEPNA